LLSPKPFPPRERGRVRKFFIDRRGLKINENLFFFKLFFGDSQKNPELSDYIDDETITWKKNTLKMEKICLIVF